MKLYWAGIQAIDVWRALEGYTLNLDSSADNDDTYVTVQDITGRGILKSIGFWKADDFSITVKITIDGGTAIEKEIAKDGADSSGAINIDIGAGFSTSSKVEMKGAIGCSARFHAVALVE